MEQFFSPTSRFLARLHGVRPCGDSGRVWYASCPLRKSKSCRLAILDNHGRSVLFACHGGCDFHDILDKLKLTIRDTYIRAES